MVPGLSTIVLLLTLYTDTVLSECSPGCTSCSGSTCLKCDTAYYLFSGFCSSCPEQCKSCNGYDDCLSCKQGKWGSDNQCQFNCGDRCYNKECHYDTGLCFHCKPGQYGPTCQQSCSLCEGDLCDSRRCTRGCKEGYYDYTSEYDESFCLKCPNDCINCSDFKTCRVCSDGFHLYKFHLNGNNFVHCVRCSLGSSCPNYCTIQNCTQCIAYMGSLVCTDCPEGSRFNGESCILNTTSCSHECSSFCDDDDICLGSCNAGWTGEKCSEKCLDKCLTCDKSNSNHCQQCRGDFYTISCNVACNNSCKTEEDKQTCRFNDGYCLNGCKHNCWGDSCDQSCSNGCVDYVASQTCERSNGTCKHGCKDRYNGDKCITIAATTLPLEAAVTTQQEVSTQIVCTENVVYKNSFVEGYFSGLGTAIVVGTALTLVLFHIRRRYIAKKLKSQQDSKRTIEMPTYYNEAVRHKHETEGEASGTNNYEQLGNTRNTDNVYNDLEATTVR